LFFTGHQHAGENLRDVLLKRAAGLPAPIQMCDGLGRNEPELPEELRVILSNCNAHARRQYVDVASRFPVECRYVLEVFRDVYGNDAVARRRGMSPEERLAFHQTESAPRMEDLRRWMAEQLDDKKVEPNSSLGEANPLYAETVGPAHPFPRGSRGAAGQQRHREDFKESDIEPEKQLLLQDGPRGPRRRHVHEPDPHCRARGGQSVRLPDTATATRQGDQKQSVTVDAPELPRESSAGQHGRGFCVDPVWPKSIDYGMAECRRAAFWQ